MEKKKEKILKAKYGSPETPLKLGELELPCYVLDDGTRVIVQRNMLTALKMSHGGRAGTDADRLTRFATGKAINPFINEDLATRIQNPVKFAQPRGGRPAYGYEATVLADLCESVLKARGAGALQKNQLHIAAQCEILMRSFAKVGIVALIDEVTGYQYDRSRSALEEILEKFISKDLQKWAKTFPDDFYEQMFRLRGWQYAPLSVSRPGVVGKYTNDLVYDRLAPGVLAELKRVTPKNASGKRKHRYFQRLTEDVGNPRLREHLAAVIALMKASTKWDNFYRSMQRALPKQGDNLELLLEEDSDKTED